MSADGIFISYRRSDSQHAAGRLADALVLVIVFFAVRACNSEAPDMAGGWAPAEGWTMDFQPQQRDGPKAYRVVGLAAGGTQLDCDAAPSFFGAIDLNGRLAGGTTPWTNSVAA